MAKYDFSGEADLNVICVVREILDRAKKGLEKYGVDTTRHDYTPKDWLCNLQEELADAIIYAEAYKRATAIIRVKKLTPDATLPVYKTPTSVGGDVTSICRYSIGPGEHKLVQTGIQLQPPQGVSLELRIRSSVAIQSVILSTGVGTIDPDYRGEIKIPLLNLGQRTFEIYKGDRLAQLMLAGGAQGVFKIADTLDSTDRGSGGFGSTGKQ